MVACRPAAWPARVERIAPGPHSVVASESEAFAAAAELAEAATPSASPEAGLGAGDATTDGRPDTEVAITAGGLATIPDAPFVPGEACPDEGGGFPAGFTPAAAGFGEGTTVDFTAAAAGFEVGCAALVAEGPDAAGRGGVVATPAGVPAGDGDCANGQQPVVTSRPSTSAESRAARDTGGWYPAWTPVHSAPARRARHDVVPAADSRP